jgi:hypothetical protein
MDVRARASMHAQATSSTSSIAAAAAAPRTRLAVAAAAARRTMRPAWNGGKKGRARCMRAAAERREYYDFQDMPPLPVTVRRISVPSLGLTLVDKSTEEARMASLAILYDIAGDDQYAKRLTRRSALTALCMYDRDDVAAAERSPGDYPVIDLLRRVVGEGLDLALEVDEFGPASGGSGS